MIWEKIADDIQPIDLKYFNVNPYEQQSSPDDQTNAYQPNSYAPYPGADREYTDDGSYTILKDNVPILTFSANLDYLAAIRQPEVETQQYEYNPHMNNPDFENLYDPKPEYNSDFHQYPESTDKTDDSLEKARTGHENHTAISFDKSDMYDSIIETNKTKFDINSNKSNGLEKARSGHENSTAISFNKSDMYESHIESDDTKFEIKTNLKDNDKSFHTTENIKHLNNDDSGSEKHNSTGRKSGNHKVPDRPVHILSKDNNYGMGNTKFEKREIEHYTDNVEKMQISVGLNKHEVCMALKNLGVSCDDVFQKMCIEKHNTLPICNRYE